MADADFIKGIHGVQGRLIGVVHQQNAGARGDGGDQVEGFPGWASGDHDDLGEVVHKILDLLEDAVLPDQVGIRRQHSPGLQAVEKDVCEGDVLVEDLLKTFFQKVDDLPVFIVLIKDDGIFHVCSPHIGKALLVPEQCSIIIG